MQWHSHNTAILVRNKETKHARYENDKREITDHENNADSNKKKIRTRNKKIEKHKQHTQHMCR